MRTMCLLFAAASIGAAQQDVERVLRFIHTETSVDLQEITTLIRSVAEIRNVTIDAAERKAVFRATGEQVALAEWLAVQLDRTASQSGAPNAQEYRFPGSDEGVVRVFFVPKAETVQEPARDRCHRAVDRRDPSRLHLQQTARGGHSRNRLAGPYGCSTN